MAATDKPYRNQYLLDVVFAITSVLMLVSIVLMFMQDYYREFKDEQRVFRDVEATLAQRQALDQMPEYDEFDRSEKAVDQARAFRSPKKLAQAIEDLEGQLEKAKADGASAEKITSLEKDLKTAKDRVQINKEYPQAVANINKLMPQKASKEQAYNTVKAKLDSISSFYDIEVDENGPGTAHAKNLYEQIQKLKSEVAEAQSAKDQVTSELRAAQEITDLYESPLTKAISQWKKVTDKFDAQVKLAITKQWGVGDAVRAFPVIDAFQSPLKIQQFTINDIPIDYNFKYVTRFDRCTTCHQGIDRPAFSRSKVKGLTRVSSDYDQKLANAHEMMKRRSLALKGLSDAKSTPNWRELQLTKVSKSELTDGRVSEFCAHPRLDLFVGANSKHPAEKFGCTSCHSGQGSATSFTLVSHTPNDSTTKKRWEKEYDWESMHMWDFPMNPVRFVESSCLKCHHQVTDLVASDNRNEAPKLIRGFNTIKEFGCFGCHEIAGRKGGRQVGPDLRLEPNPPLESLTPAERLQAEADVDNPPGTMRKVGPSLYRLAEKTNPDWVRKWIRAPRSFRPDTKMPHYYGLSNNDATALKGTGQEKFPETEIWAITHFLFEASNGYLKDVSAMHKEDAGARAKDAAMLAEQRGFNKLSDAQKKEMDAIVLRNKMRDAPLLVDLAPGYKADAEHGRRWFSERGCLACHSHQGVETAQGKPDDKNYAPAMADEANFAPDLSQLVEKLGTKRGDKESARKWLIQWIVDPHVHSPRSRMPVMHLTNTEAADVAAWLLAQSAQHLGAEWNELTVLEPDPKDLRDLAKVYLVRILSQSTMDRFLEKGELPREIVADLPVEEKELAQNFSDANLKRYLGKKAVGRQGCFGCHDIPGYDNTKSIGVGLNDWGKKDPGRLAFEDINGFLKTHFKVVPSLVDAEGNPVPAKVIEKHKDGTTTTKETYEEFYADALEHRQREGFLNQKLIAPRSYDYNRLRTWDDRLRMPQFRFGRSRKKDKESDEDFLARANKEEADAREAVSTFILGLVADPVPMASVNQPKGDRLYEVKGRQILDKYNCGGCHLVRPGSFEIQVNDNSMKTLELTYKVAQGRAKQGGDQYFGFHANWVGMNPAAPDRLKAAAARARIYVDEDDPNLKSAEFRLTRALRFQGAEDKLMKDIEAQSVLRLAPRDMIYPPPEAWDTPETLAAFLKDKGPYGGTFADLLVEYLVNRDKGAANAFFVRDVDGDSSKARLAVPPILLGQGERTQPEWLYQFLRNPSKVRQMTVLQMPKFNMSNEEAQTLVNYFAAVERAENPGIGLKFPYETVPQQEPFTDSFWLQKNIEYIAKLKAGKTKNAQGKEASLYDKRLEELRPIWQHIQTDMEQRLNQAKASKEGAKIRLDAAEKAAKNNPALEESLKNAKDTSQAWDSEWEFLSKQAKNSTLEGQQKTWETEDAYVSDSFKVLSNKQLCVQCHQIGLIPNNNQIQGPPLYLAYQRLRPGWLERWVGAPQRFLTYGSSMPNNFPVDKPGQYQELFAGSPLEQIEGVRDLLMAYPRASALPVNHYLALPLISEAKKAEPKKSETKSGDKK